MKTVQISLNSIDKVKSFVNDITKFDVDFDLVSGRYMMKIAEELGKESKCMGLVTGESIGQVASQTMQSLYCIWKICN